MSPTSYRAAPPRNRLAHSTAFGLVLASINEKNIELIMAFCNKLYCKYPRNLDTSSLIKTGFENQATITPETQ